MKKIILWILVVLWMCLIFIMSSMNANESNDISKGIITKTTENTTNKINKPIDKTKENNIINKYNVPLRKCAHASEFLVLGLLLILSLKSTFKINYKLTSLITLITCIIYASLDEIHQIYVPGRTSSIKDVLIDTIGSLIIISVYILKNVVKTCKKVEIK